MRPNLLFCQQTSRRWGWRSTILVRGRVWDRTTWLRARQARLHRSAGSFAAPGAAMVSAVAPIPGSSGPPQSGSQEEAASSEEDPPRGRLTATEQAPRKEALER